APRRTAPRAPGANEPRPLERGGGWKLRAHASRVPPAQRCPRLPARPGGARVGGVDARPQWTVGSGANWRVGLLSGVRTQPLRAPRATPRPRANLRRRDGELVPQRGGGAARGL